MKIENRDSQKAGKKNGKMFGDRSTLDAVFEISKIGAPPTFAP